MNSSLSCLAKESISPAPVHMHKMSIGSQIAIGLCLLLFHQHHNPSKDENRMSVSESQSLNHGQVVYTENVSGKLELC